MTDKTVSTRLPDPVVSGALAHLAQHLENGCQRSAYLAALLLDHIAGDDDNDIELRRQARLLAELLDAGDMQSAARRFVHRGRSPAAMAARG